MAYAQDTSALNGASFNLGSLWESIKLRLKTGLFNFQTARLASALNSMSDTDLARLGVKRSDIAQHAKTVINQDYDGL